MLLAFAAPVVLATELEIAVGVDLRGERPMRWRISVSSRDLGQADAFDAGGVPVKYFVDEGLA